MNTSRIEQFDRVQILTTKNIKWLSIPEGVPDPSPHGVWSVICIVKDELLICKRGVSCKVPVGDIKKVESSTFGLKKLENNNGKASQSKSSS